MTINSAIVERARAGELLTAAELDELGSSDVLSLGMLADEVRRARVGDSVTYTRVVDFPGGAGTASVTGAELRLSTVPATLDDAEAWWGRHDRGQTAAAPGSRQAGSAPPSGMAPGSQDSQTKKTSTTNSGAGFDRTIVLHTNGDTSS